MRKILMVLALTVTTLLAAVTAVVASAHPAGASEAAPLPGMCNGRSDPNLVVIAHANGPVSPRFILNVNTDRSGHPSGSLMLGRGPGTLTASNWCRVWQHLPGSQPQGDCETAYPVGAITAHAVGIGSFGGHAVVVRVDVRKYADGTMGYRLRYQPWNPSQGATTLEDSCNGEWTWVPAEETWSPLTQFMVKATS